MTGQGHLVVAYNFPPFVDASAVTQAKRIVAAGKQVDVISQDMTGLRIRDDELLRLVAPFVRQHDLIAGRPAFLAWASMRQFAVRGMRRITTNDSLSRYATVYSRSMWPHSHVLAALIKSRHPSIRWSAEFSDPLLHHVDGTLRRSPPLPTTDPVLGNVMRALAKPYRTYVESSGDVLHLIQALTFGLADTLVFTNAQQRTVMLNDLRDDELARDAHRRSELAPHPVPPREWALPRAAGDDAHAQVCRIGYFGTLYPNRGLGSLMEAVRLLPPRTRSKLQIDVYTSQRKTSFEQVARNGVGDVIHLLHELPYLTFLQTASTYDHLLVTDTHTGGYPVANPFLPSKLSDYLATGVNILALTTPGSELDQRDLAIKANVHDAISIRDSLTAAVLASPRSRTNPQS